MNRLHTIAQTIIDKLEAQELIEALVRLSDDPGKMDHEIPMEEQDEDEQPSQPARVIPSTTVETDWKLNQERPWCMVPTMCNSSVRIVVDARLVRQNGFSVYDMKSLMAFRRDFKLML